MASETFPVGCQLVFNKYTFKKNNFEKGWSTNNFFKVSLHLVIWFIEAAVFREITKKWWQNNGTEVYHKVLQE